MAEVLQKYKVVLDDGELRSKIAGTRLFLDSQLTRTTSSDTQIATGRALIDNYNASIRSRLFSPIGGALGSIMAAQSSQDPGLLNFQNRFGLMGGIASENLGAFGRREFYANALMGGGFNPNMSSSALAARTGAMQMYAGLSVGTFSGLMTPRDLMNKAGLAGDFKYQFEAKNFNEFVSQANASGVGRMLSSPGRVDSFFNQYRQAQPFMESLNIGGAQSATLASNLLRTGARPDQLNQSMRAFGSAMAAGAPQELVSDSLAENRRMQVAFMKAGMRGKGVSQTQLLGGTERLETELQIRAEDLGVTLTDDLRAGAYSAHARMTALLGRNLDPRERQYASMRAFGASVLQQDQGMIDRRVQIAEDRRRSMLAQGEEQNRNFQVMEEQFSSLGGFIKNFSPGLYNRMQKFTSGPLLNSPTFNTPFVGDVNPRFITGNTLQGVGAGSTLGLSGSPMMFGTTPMTNADYTRGMDAYGKMSLGGRAMVNLKAAGSVLMTPGASFSMSAVAAQAMKLSGASDPNVAKSQDILNGINSDAKTSRENYLTSLQGAGITSEAAAKSTLEAMSFVRGGQQASAEGNTAAASEANKKFEAMIKDDPRLKAYFESDIGKAFKAGDKDAIGKYETAISARNQAAGASLTSYIAKNPGQVFENYLAEQLGTGKAPVRISKEWDKINNASDRTAMANQEMNKYSTELNRRLTSGTEEEKKGAMAELTDFNKSAYKQMTGQTFSSASQGFASDAQAASDALAKLAKSSSGSPRR